MSFVELGFLAFSRKDGVRRKASFQQASSAWRSQVVISRDGTRIAIISRQGGDGSYVSAIHNDGGRTYCVVAPSCARHV
ncbi:MAG: hypothetical protein KF693_15245 [Nitrospira sp.]|nr:hypothetical protein [Nitrospira sp.]